MRRENSSRSYISRTSLKVRFDPMQVFTGPDVASWGGQTFSLNEGTSAFIADNRPGRRRISSGFYSFRSARIGSVRAARLAGIQLAAIATNINSSAAPSSVEGS
jgi:hypothetical protein